MAKFADKDPADVLDYMVDWSEFLADGEELVDATMTVSPTGQLVINSVSHDATSVTIIASGGTVNQRYTLTCQVETTTANVVNRKFTLSVKDL